MLPSQNCAELVATELSVDPAVWTVRAASFPGSPVLIFKMLQLILSTESLVSMLCIFLCNRVFLLNESLLGREEPETSSAKFPPEKCPESDGCACLSPPGPHGHAHTADHGAAAEEDQSDRDRDEPAVSPRREYRFRGPLLLLPRPVCICTCTHCGLGVRGLELSSLPRWDGWRVSTVSRS